MTRVAAVVLAVVAAFAATTASAAPLDTTKPWLAPFANLTAQMKAAATNSGTPKQRILNGTKPTTAILDALNAKRTVVQGAMQSSLAAKVNASAAATKAVVVLRNVSATKTAALKAQLKTVEQEVEEAQEVVLAKLNNTKVSVCVCVRVCVALVRGTLSHQGRVCLPGRVGREKKGAGGSSRHAALTTTLSLPTHTQDRLRRRLRLQQDQRKGGSHAKRRHLLRQAEGLQTARPGPRPQPVGVGVQRRRGRPGRLLLGGPDHEWAGGSRVGRRVARIWAARRPWRRPVGRCRARGRRDGRHP